jgi:hypothetical protein
MKKSVKIFVLVVVALVVAVGILRFAIGGDEDTWICSNGQWVKHGHPSAPQPTTTCGSNHTK